MQNINHLKTANFIARYKNNPVLSATDIPYKSTLVFNAGVERYKNGYVMVFRNDYGEFKRDNDIFEGTNIGLAFSKDGINWKVEPKPCMEWKDNEVIRAYDPRLTKIEGRYYMCFALDTKHGIRGGIAVTDNFKVFEIMLFFLQLHY
jgi:beta-1,4-mannooligosaccharide/beta-1,4-mannosyl-N-acetylglucosamine phosphorylase